ncbi:hypothetical protein [Nitratireductor thuwali]|uniref:DUF3604 domain-containing protein n=1 Tax=Nitratireductor thuwali TaxID=2267699 RepID=A0ABY5MFI5_9HYPH|nr:hypothetical protein NTH_00373 [Nitratireductor thuwali]
MSAPRLPDHLTPLAASLGLRPLYGDIHNHCALSYGHGSLDNALARARLQLDFVSVTGHADWPDMPVDEPEVAHIVDFHVKGFARLRESWPRHFATLARYNEEGRFTVFPGYEIHSCAHGDLTTVYADLEAADIVLAESPGELRRKLHAAMGRRAFAFPHHIGYRQGARGINWATFDTALSPFVEMNSMHGCAETSESERSYLHSMGPVDGASTMRAGLAAGHVFGVVGNTDHHSGYPGSYGHGRMGLYARSNSREDIWQAMQSRRTNALTGDNVHLLTAVGDTVQGGVLAPQEHAVLSIEAVAGGFIDCIDVIRNSALFQRITPQLSPAPVAVRADGWLETVLYVELGWGARGRSHLWEGELSLQGGEILAVEPRFRGAEIVSPLEGEEAGHPLPELSFDGKTVRFAVTADANPNNVTAATQGLALRLRLDEASTVRAELCGKPVMLPARRLFEGAVSGNLGPIDSPAYRFHSLPRPQEWQWGGVVALGRIEHGENLYVRLRQQGGQMAWASPIFCRREAAA